MKYKIVKCKICNKPIKTEIKTIGNKRVFSFRESEDGVLFNRVVWFCSPCWDLLIKEVNKWKKRE